MAAAMVRIKISEVKLARVRRQLAGFPRALPMILSRSINRTTTTARAQTARLFGEKVNMKITYIKKAMKRITASRRKLKGVISISPYRIALSYFKGNRQKKTGVSYMIDKDTGRRILAHGFIQTMASGHKVILKRQTSKRYPIMEPRGPSLGVIFESGRRKIGRRVRRSTRNTFIKNIDQQVALALSKRTG